MAEFGRLRWATDLLQRLDLPVTKENLTAIVAWQIAEGGHDNGASWNPLNTTWEKPGSRDFNQLGNGVGVQIYKSYEQGMDATIDTLRLGHYRKIIAALRKGNSAKAVGQALATSPWGTGALMLGTIDRARAYLAEHAHYVQSVTKGNGSSAGGRDESHKPRDPWALDRPRRLRPWQPLKKVGDYSKKAMTFWWIDQLSEHLTDYLAEVVAVDRVTRHDVRELDIHRMHLARPGGQTAVRRALHGVLDEDQNFPTLLRSLARDVEFVVGAEAKFRNMDVDGDKTVASLAALLSDGRGRKYAKPTVSGVIGWLNAVLDPPGRKRLPTGPGRRG